MLTFSGRLVFIILASASAILFAALMLPILTSAQTTQCVDLTHTLRLGSTDATTNGEVSKLQRFLTETGDYTYGSVTGYFGPATEEAVKRFQCRKGIVCSGTPETTGYGVVGARTRAAMGCSSTTHPVIGPQCLILQMNLYRGHTDAQTNGEVSKLQQFLKDIGHYTATVNGIFDEATENAVKAYQCARGIVCSGTPETTGYGVVGPKTREDMRRNCGVTTAPPSGGWSTDDQCPQRTMRCPDGTVVGPTGPQCRFICPDPTTSTNLPPVIKTIEGPTTRDVDQTGRWRIEATDPENGLLSYRVSWGDGASTPPSFSDTFEHTYSSPGTFSLIATVKDDGGAESASRISVLVGNPASSGCSTEYIPVCGIPAVCSSSAKPCMPTTYINRCNLDAARAMFLYEGVCQPGVTGNASFTSGQCPQDAKQCPDGSYVFRTGPNCMYPQCPTHSRSICETTYKPVCGKPSDPCLLSHCQERTYENRCLLEADGATFLYDGKCRPRRHSGNPSASDDTTPRIYYFTANPTVVVPGGTTTLSWSANTRYCAFIGGGPGIPSTGSVVVTQTVTSTYTLVCPSTAVPHDSASVTVRVALPGPATHHTGTDFSQLASVLSAVDTILKRISSLIYW